MPIELKKGIYRHYKGKEYQVLFIATHSESEEALVIYQTLYGNYDHWARPLSMFVEDVTIDGKTQPRFQFVREE
ncbi:DUF1653 domain-containing protein [Pseudoalteromonas luteoviolacea]|uniref:DUF1653 domain-containing protein n=1 Tax=Pseudoalteromonas luteoviolacea H33 TaxID=1365251 RepID=A0A167FQD0_9GAMM|nr:DUF1653 domain-containing protein [Pseudoalteromonas luteoviolacea]KZN52621.1 hypothetical protein N476_11195 [Pseudoalteromonas luteoviolacea H33]KZN76447.1 hypothetical protein N477_15160 [Pseudoalteromonas luteoviolacea H33-S]